MERKPGAIQEGTNVTGHTIVLEQRTSASVDQVWSVLTDLEAAVGRLQGVEAIEVLTDGPYAVGTTWRETRGMFGKSETQEMSVAEADAPHRTVVTASAGGVDYTTTFTVSPTADGALIRMEFGGEQPDAGVVAKLTWAVMGKLGAMVTKRVMAGDLRDIAAAAERL